VPPGPRPGVILVRVGAGRIVIIALLCVAAAGLGVAGAGCAQQRPQQPASRQAARSKPSVTGGASAVHAHPQAVEPVAGAAAPAGQPSSAVAGVSVGPVGSSLPQPVSETEIRQQLTQSGMSASPNQATLTPAGLAVAPIDAPAVVQEVIAAGNEIARLPYRYGGGHLTYEDTAYDCSGSISYVFAAAHLLDHTVVSGELENWGDPGPGRWITVFANAGHTFMYVAGLRFDTVALAETGSRWSARPADEPDLRTFSVRHPPGL
jgi:cell wall-associated NlpC family hydrolase